MSDIESINAIYVIISVAGGIGLLSLFLKLKYNINMFRLIKEKLCSKDPPKEDTTPVEVVIQQPTEMFDARSSDVPVVPEMGNNVDKSNDNTSPNDEIKNDDAVDKGCEEYTIKPDKITLIDEYIVHR